MAASREQALCQGTQGYNPVGFHRAASRPLYDDQGLGAWLLAVPHTTLGQEIAQGMAAKVNGDLRNKTMSMSAALASVQGAQHP